MKRFLLLLVACYATVAFPEPARSVGEKMTKGSGPNVIPLPKPRVSSQISVEEAILHRRSVRHYRSEPLTLAEVGQLLWAAQGITSPGALRAAPSAGALYPLELYVVAGRIEMLEAGVYHYIPARHELIAVKGGDLRGGLSRAALGQSAVQDAPASLVVSAQFSRTTRKYGERGLRYVYMDLGHAAENVYLQAEALQLGTVIIGAFDDNLVAKVLSLPAAEQPLAIMPVGRRH